VRKLKWVFLGAVGVAVIVFVGWNLYKASRPPASPTPVESEGVPARVYGRLEPAGGEVYVSPPVTRSVEEIRVTEGEVVAQGEVLCVLERDVEKARFRVAEARVASLRKSVELERDTFERRGELFANGRISEYEYTQAKLAAELAARNLQVANGELALARAELAQLELRSPVAGVVYKIDLRLGETIRAGDNTKIVVGGRGYWVRLYVESFWVDRVREGTAYKVYDAETGAYVGLGKVVERKPYLGGRDFQSDDLRERFDTKFQEVILDLEPAREGLPLGLSVVAELAPPN
jgi:RND family efflux transporter MFP subunit